MNLPLRLAATIALAGLASIGGAASAQNAASTCRLVRIAEWPVRLVQNKILVDGAVNGRKVAVMIDTGAASTLIVRSSAQRLGLSLQDVRGLRMFGVGGETRVQSADVDDITIGGVTRKDMRLLVAGEHDLGARGDIVLGQDFLARVDIEFDLAHNAIRLFEASGCEGVSLAYWATDGGSSVEIDTSTINSHIGLKVEVNGVPVDAILDSGASMSVVDSSYAREVGVTPQAPGVKEEKLQGLGENPVETWTGTFATVVIGNERIRDAKLVVADYRDSARTVGTGSNVKRAAVHFQPMIVGADFIRAHRLLVSHSKGIMYFTYVGGPVFGLPSGDDATGRGSSESPVGK